LLTTRLIFNSYLQICCKNDWNNFLLLNTNGPSHNPTPAFLISVCVNISIIQSHGRHWESQDSKMLLLTCVYLRKISSWHQFIITLFILIFASFQRPVQLYTLCWQCYTYIHMHNIVPVCLWKRSSISFVTCRTYKNVLAFEMVFSLHVKIDRMCVDLNTNNTNMHIDIYAFKHVFNMQSLVLWCCQIECKCQLNTKEYISIIKLLIKNANVSDVSFLERSM